MKKNKLINCILIFCAMSLLALLSACYESRYEYNAISGIDGIQTENIYRSTEDTITNNDDILPNDDMATRQSEDDVVFSVGFFRSYDHAFHFTVTQNGMFEASFGVLKTDFNEDLIDILGIVEDSGL